MNAGKVLSFFRVYCKMSNGGKSTYRYLLNRIYWYRRRNYETSDYKWHSLHWNRRYHHWFVWKPVSGTGRRFLQLLPDTWRKNHRDGHCGRQGNRRLAIQFKGRVKREIPWLPCYLPLRAGPCCKHRHIGRNVPGYETHWQYKDIFHAAPVFPQRFFNTPGSGKRGRHPFFRQTCPAVFHGSHGSLAGGHGNIWTVGKNSFLRWRIWKIRRLSKRWPWWLGLRSPPLLF